MAQTGFTPIQLYRSSTPTNAPSAGNLADGELAINTADGKLFYKDSGGVVQVLASQGSASVGGSNTQIQYNSSGSLAGSANLTFDGSTFAVGVPVVSTNAAGLLTRAAATQDGVEVIGRAGGTSSYKVTFTPTTLSASRILTLPDNTGTLLTTGATVTVANGGTGQTTYTDGQLLIGNTTGNTLTKATLTAGTGISITNGSGSITITNTASGTPTLNVVTGTTQAAVANNHYVLTNVAATTVTLPATPAAGDVVWITVGNGLTTNVVARNGSNIQSLAEDLTLNAAYAAVQMRYINSTIGWTFV